MILEALELINRKGGTGPEQMHFVVNCIVFGFGNDKFEVLLTPQRYPGEDNKWSLIGDVVGINENLDDMPQKIFQDLFGIEDFYSEQVHTYGRADCHYYGRLVTTTYLTPIFKSRVNNVKMEDYGAQWFAVDNLPSLILEQEKMIMFALDVFRKNIRTSAICFELLPNKFTLPKLQTLFEIVLDVKIDKRNFRSKLMKMDLLIKLNEKDHTNSRKGASLYCFDEKKYNRTREFNI